MVSVATFRKLALSFKGAVEHKHFDVQAFKVKRIFATLDEKNNRVCLMLSPIDQSVFCTYDKSVMYPVPNKWGLQGATYVELKKVRKDLLIDALNQSYEKSVQKKPNVKKTLSVLFFLLSSFIYAQDGHIDTLIGNDGQKYVNKTFEYPGGLQELNKDVAAAFVLPKTAAKDKIHGKMLLEFTVDTLGRATDAKIIEGIRPDVDSAAIKICKKLKRFKPSTVGGRKVPQRMNIPLTL